MADSAGGDRNGNNNIKISKHHKQLLKDKIGSLISRLHHSCMCLLF